MRLTIYCVSLVALALGGCGRTSCYGLTDRETLESIQRAYADRGQWTPEIARNSKVEQHRVVGVERFGREGEDAFVGLLFRQDNGEVLGVRLFEDCTFQTSRSENGDLKDRAYSLAPPSF